VSGGSGAAVGVSTRAAIVAVMSAAVAAIASAELGLDQNRAARGMGNIGFSQFRSMNHDKRFSGRDRVRRRRSRKGDGDERQSQQPVNHGQHGARKTSFATTVKRDNHHSTHHGTVADAEGAVLRKLWPIYRIIFMRAANSSGGYAPRSFIISEWRLDTIRSIFEPRRAIAKQR
jgi:hypothetical protein